MPDCYQDLIDAGLQPGEDFSVSTGNLDQIGQCLLIAPHAGAIEPGTGRLVHRVAEMGGWAYYLFEGRLDNDNWSQLHIPSENFDEPTLLELLPQTPFVVSFHGASDEHGQDLFIGGLFEEGRRTMISELQDTCRALGITQVDATTSGPRELAGLDPQNITNRGTTGAGIQLEISHRARKLFFESLRPQGRTRPQASLDQVAACVNRALVSLTADQL